MNPFDILMIIIVLYCLIAGIFKGIVWELTSVFGVIAGFFAAYFSYPKVGEYFLSKWITSPAYLNLLSFLLVFCAVFILISVLGLIIRYLLKIASLSWRNRLGGSGLGILRGVLISAVLLLIFTAFLKEGTPIIRDSELAPYVMLISDPLTNATSGSMKSDYDKKSAVFKKIWQSRKRK